MQPPSQQDLRVTVRTLKYLHPGSAARELGNALKKDHKWVLRWWGRYPNLRTLKTAIRRECRGSWVFDWLKATFATMDDRMQAVIDAIGQHMG